MVFGEAIEENGTTVLPLKLTAKAPENRPRSQEDMSCSSIFRGRLSVSGSKKSQCMTQVLIVVGVSPFQLLKGPRFLFSQNGH